MASQAIILSLPNEIVEEILVYSAEMGTPQSISELAQTCRHFRQLIYDPLDKFLWRRAFLTTFDDPRTSCEGGPQSETVPFDWADEFRIRVWTASYVKRRINDNNDARETSYRLRSKKRASPTHVECETFAKALHTLVRVLDTTARAVNHEAELDSLGTALSTASLVDADNRAPTAPLAVDTDDPSKNVAWLTSIAAQGLPREFNPRFSLIDTDPYWATVEDVQAVHKIVAFLGVNFEKTWAAKPPMGRTTPPRPRSKAARCEFVSTDKSDLTPEELFLRARYLARREVFNVNYLSRRRAWGPFLPYREPGTDGDEEAEESDSDSDDSDYNPTEVPNTEDEDASDVEDDEEYAPRKVQHKPPPPPENLCADWIHLSAIRMVAQAGLQEHPQWADMRDALMSWDSIRPGAWLPRNTPDTATEWDWAGVEGVWRRCVCWLDYTELYYHNKRGFRSADFDQATLIVPLTIRIVGYSPATVAGYEHRPTIRIEGEMGGSGWADNVDARRIYGTVGVIGDGNIRWSITSSKVGEPLEDEWASEGVQVGGPASASGVLGLWTGAEHDANDPLGGWWQWRVA